MCLFFCEYLWNVFLFDFVGKGFIFKRFFGVLLLIFKFTALDSKVFFYLFWVEIFWYWDFGQPVAENPGLFLCFFFLPGKILF